MTREEKPGPCPFCGSEKTSLYHVSYPLYHVSCPSFVWCLDCGARGPRYPGIFTHHRTQGKAVSLWNAAGLVRTDNQRWMDEATRPRRRRNPGRGW